VEKSARFSPIVVGNEVDKRVNLCGVGTSRQSKPEYFCYPEVVSSISWGGPILEQRMAYPEEKILLLISVIR
jgi:hypothetical protein